MNNHDDKNMLKLVIDSAIEAGKAILNVYATDFDVDYKADESPLTKADQAAHNIITKYLEKTNIPILSEEGKHLPYSVREKWEKLWIVDPLDGTKEFVKRNGEFTVNIALVEKNKPVMGVIFCPTLKILYFAGQSVNGAFRSELDNDWVSKEPDSEKAMKTAIKLPLNKNLQAFTVVASRSHLNDETKSYVKKIEAQTGEIQFTSRGSSLKLCMVAEGGAELYPRFAPTSEWDTAAGQAIIEFSGGKVILPESGKPMRYNKADILNPWFLAVGKDVEHKIDV